jgi:CRP/FNR family transcriptional regulator
MTPAPATGTKVPPPASCAALGFFAELPDAARRALLAGAVERRFGADEVLFLAGTPARGLYVVTEGRVRVVRGAGGRPHVIHEEGVGGTLGEVPLFEGSTYPATAVAAEPTRCLLLTRESVRAAVRAEPDIALALLARLAARVRHLVDRVDSRTARPALQRLADLLIERHRAAGGRSFVLARTQQAAAEELGTVREVVVRGLRALRHDGVIRTAGGGRYVVTDENALRRLSSGAA